MKNLALGSKLISRCFIVAIAGLAANRAAVAEFAGDFELQNWSITQNGAFDSTSITPASGAAEEAVFSISIDLGEPGPGVSERSADFEVEVGESGTITFGWQFAGFHAFFNAFASAEILLNGTPFMDLQPSTSVSGGFMFSGTGTVVAVSAGDIFGLRITGRNGDSNSELNSALTVTNFSFVPTNGAEAPVDPNPPTGGTAPTPPVTAPPATAPPVEVPGVETPSRPTIVRTMDRDQVKGEKTMTFRGKARNGEVIKYRYGQQKIGERKHRVRQAKFDGRNWTIQIRNPKPNRILRVWAEGSDYRSNVVKYRIRKAD